MSNEFDLRKYGKGDVVQIESDIFEGEATVGETSTEDVFVGDVNVLVVDTDADTYVIESLSSSDDPPVIAPLPGEGSAPVDCLSHAE